MTLQMTDKELDNYMSNIERVSSEYNLFVNDLFDLVDYQDFKRVRRNEERNLERSLDVVERYLRIKRK